MNRAEQPAILVAIPDVQSGRDERRIAIDQVGIKGLRYPLPFMDRDGVAHTTIATCNVYVALPDDRKGTHMSRLVALLEVHDRNAVDHDSVKLVGKPEIVLGAERLRAEIVEGEARHAHGRDHVVQQLAGLAHTISVSVPVTSLCPSSKEVSAYGAHNQRSIVTINVRPREHLFVAELLRIAEEEASAELYGILKRADEKYVTERAYDNPRFVEDLVRGVAARLAEDSRIDGFVVEAENFESIHNHSAYARIARNF